MPAEALVTLRRSFRMWRAKGLRHFLEAQGAGLRGPKDNQGSPGPPAEGGARPAAAPGEKFLPSGAR